MLISWHEVYYLNIFRVPLKSRECSAARDALAKSIYSRIFDLIVSKINKSIPFRTQLNNINTNDTNYIGVLDIAGFGWTFIYT